MVPAGCEAPRTAQIDNETRFGAVAWYTSLLRTTLSMRRSGRWERRHGLLGENTAEAPPRQSSANHQVEPAWLRGKGPYRGVRLLRGCPSRVASGIDREECHTALAPDGDRPRGLPRLRPGGVARRCTGRFRSQPAHQHERPSGWCDCSRKHPRTARRRESPRQRGLSQRDRSLVGRR